ncbi:MAG TPA: hypothetical protein VMW84_00340, partial [Acidobacteriota bacterium]|nr:hypothetical protein [Acidobacteriota bacterium]
TLCGITGTIGNFSYAQFVMHDKDTSLVLVSPLTDDGSGFTVSYLESPSATTLVNDLTIQSFTIQRGGAFSAYAKTAVSKKIPRFSGAYE